MLPGIRSSLFAIGLLLLVGCQRASSPADPAAPRTDAQNSPTGTGPTASEVWAKTRAVYREAQSYTDNSTIVEYSVARARGVANRLPYHQLALAFERPDKIYLAYADAVASSAGKTEYRIASDGNIMRSWASEVPLQVHEAIAPRVLTTENFIAEPLLRAELLQVGLENLFPQLALLLTDDPDQPIFPHDHSPRLLREEKLAGRTCFRLQTHSPAGRRVLWIDQENYRLRRMELPIDAEQTALNPDGQFIKFSVWIDFADVCFDAKVQPSSFQLSVPPGGRRVRRFIAPPPPAPTQTSAADRPIGSRHSTHRGRLGSNASGLVAGAGHGKRGHCLVRYRGRPVASLEPAKPSANGSQASSFSKFVVSPPTQKAGSQAAWRHNQALSKFAVNIRNLAQSLRTKYVDGRGSLGLAIY